MKRKGRQTHERRVVPVVARRYRGDVPSLKTRTPIVGDVILYETWSGDMMHPDDARKMMDAGHTLYYTTWENNT